MSCSAPSLSCWVDFRTCVFQMMQRPLFDTILGCRELWIQMSPGHRRNLVNLAALTELTSIHLYVKSQDWPFHCLQNLSKLKAVYLQLDHQEAWHSATGPLLQQQALSSLLLWCVSNTTAAPQVSNSQTNVCMEVQRSCDSTVEDCQSPPLNSAALSPRPPS